MSLIDNIRKKVQKEFDESVKPKKFTESKEQFGAVEFAVTSMPRIVEKKNKDFVSYGDDNLWPQQIEELSKKSAIHGAIIKTASDMITGDGFFVNGAKTKEENDVILSQNREATEKYNLFLENKYDELTVEEIKANIALDLKKHGGYYMEFIWNRDFTSIARIKYIPYKNIRAGKLKDNKLSTFYYSRDWAAKNVNPTEMFAFDPKDKEHTNQLFYRKLGVDDYYGEPDYIQGIDWINVDYQMGVFHLSNIENGMNPSLLWRFFKKPATENDKQDVLDDIRRNYRGASKTGKHVVLFSDGKELAAEVAPIATNNLDKQLLLLAELCDKKILTAHKLTSPLLAGISVSGQIGGNVELEKAYNIYDKTRIAPYRNIIDRDFQRVLDINKIPYKIKTNPFNPFI